MTAGDLNHPLPVCVFKGTWMSLLLVVEERCSPFARVWRLRSLLLLFAIATLGYTGAIYLDVYLHQREGTRAFERVRKAERTSPDEAERPEMAPFTAQLAIPRLNLTAMVEEGVGENVLRRAAGHIPNTALPGSAGNVGVAAHRDTLFRRLKGITAKDRIVLSTPKADYQYEVVSTRIVKPSDVSVLDPSPGEKTLTLVTCYPFEYVGNAPKRFIVRARQIGFNARTKKRSTSRVLAASVNNSPLLP